PLTSPNPSSPTAHPTPGRGGAFKTNQTVPVSSFQSPSSPWEGGREVGEEGRGGEGPGGTDEVAEIEIGGIGAYSAGRRSTNSRSQASGSSGFWPSKLRSAGISMAGGGSGLLCEKMASDQLLPPFLVR